MSKHAVVCIPGDGIGPEVTTAVQRILAAADAPLEWVERQAGIAALKNGADVCRTRRSRRSSTTAWRSRGRARRRSARASRR